jgi:hypothetical protein
LRRTPCYDTNLSSFVAKSNDRPTGKEIGFSWYFWPGWFEPGNRRSSLSSQRRCCAGIGSSSVCSGSANRRRIRESRGFRLRRSVLIKEMAVNNRLWGAERIRGKLLKLDIRVSKRTIQKYMRHIRTTQPRGQNWRTFLRNHAAEIWACDFLQVTDLFFRPFLCFSSSSCSRERLSMSM